MSTGNWFHSLEALTEKHNWPKELELRGTTQSPPKADLVVLPQEALSAFFVK